ncbi:elongation factor P [candidate division KSB1 bacterium]|nr:MAG: elongation factor P [candidate division KSB1 bacterium]
MATTADIRKGLTIQMEGQIFVVADFQHVKPGKGGAFVRITLKNVKTARVIERTLNSGASIDIVRVDVRDMQFLYQEGDMYHFMDQESYEQIPLGKELIGDGTKWMKEGIVCRVSFIGEQPLSMEVPNFLELEITQTAPGVKGDTVSGSGKPATLETGAVVQVPFFVDQGDIIRVDTRTSAYLDRVKRA